ncbi:protein FAR1-RELATED SEQUENCE 5-like [Apium graveolens]|uniref:protein FAR1-RELATED SEQUENCE 5-like n=1 Tax=Apium graveolens TaxID=4045 RepID=UPI003D7C0513
MVIKTEKLILVFSPGGHKYYVPFSVEDDAKPFVNKVFENLESSIQFYKVYANLYGLEVHRSTEKIDDDGIVLSKYLLCNKSGFNENNSKSVKKRRTKSVRCDSDAKMVLNFFPGKRYNMVFAPFTGVNKHNKCVTFASTLLSKEDVTHFTRAFITLLKAMGRNPVYLVTDQCPAMKQAIPVVFKAIDDIPSTRNRLCNFLCKETDFMEKIKKVIWSTSIDIDEFSEFYIRFECIMDKQRKETKRLNHNSTYGKPTIVTKFFLKDDAAKLYMRDIFYKVQDEIMAARDDMRIQTIGPEINDIKCYEMRDVKMKDMIFKVEVSKTHANCSYKKFLLCGILNYIRKRENILKLNMFFISRY